MRRTIRGSIAAALAGAGRARSRAGPGRTREAAAGERRRHPRSKRSPRHYRHYGSNRAALRAFGIIAGTIASIAAAEAARRDCRYYGGCYYDYGYRYGPPRYYYRPRSGYYFYFGF